MDIHSTSVIRDDSTLHLIQHLSNPLHKHISSLIYGRARRYMAEILPLPQYGRALTKGSNPVVTRNRRIDLRFALEINLTLSWISTRIYCLLFYIPL